MDDLDFVKKLEVDDELFDKEYDKLGDFYNLRHYWKVHDYIAKHKGLIVFLNKLKPRLIDSFPTGKFDLILNTDFEYPDWATVILFVKVDEYTFDNGVMEDIDKIFFDFLPLQQKLGVMPNLAIWPALYDC
ncbi:hypothetical protein [Methanobrevibacter sp. UBA188]|uniref:hypothetical protein n=1 Tax=Methanobrevibacter sp. UBA188 TaxID=1915473 RepID=UPI0025F5F520|nr:hypothetical protein [Methanobrevibacter sp. UBA188]